MDGGLQHRAPAFPAGLPLYPGNTSCPNPLRVRFDGVNSMSGDELEKLKRKLQEAMKQKGDQHE